MQKTREIEKNIRVTEGMRNLQDYQNMRNFYKTNAEYQEYYTMIYPPDTIGQLQYETANAASNFSNRFPPKSSI